MSTVLHVVRNLQWEVAFAPWLVALVQTSQTLSVWPNFQSKLNARNQFLSHTPSTIVITMVLHDHSCNLVNDLAISAFLWPTRTCSTLHRRAGIFIAIVPHLNLGEAHGIVAEDLLERLDVPLRCHHAFGKF